MDQQPGHDYSAPKPAENPKRAESPSLKSLVQEAAELAYADKDVNWAVSMLEEAWDLDADYRKVVKALAELLIEASKGLGAGGCVRIWAENLHSRDSEDHSIQLAQGRWVRLTMKNDGLEMQPLSPDGKFDYGLGPVTCKTGIDGEISFYVPAQAGRDDKIAGADSKPRILVMDDEESVCEIATQMLEYLGYQVEVAIDGDEAAFKYKEARDKEKPFDAVILDLTVPDGLGAAETVKKLESIDPDVVALISSGYFDDPAMCEFKDYGFSGAIQKPFRLKVLSGVLDGIIKDGKSEDPVQS